MRIKTKKKGNAFTIVELVIVIGVIGILSAILVPTITNLVSKANTRAGQADALNAYKLYQIDALDGYIGDANQLSETQKEKYALRRLEPEYIYFSESKNAEIATGDAAWHYIDDNWQLAAPKKLVSVCESYDYNATNYGRFYAFYDEAKLESITINAPATTFKKGASVKLSVTPSPKTATAAEIIWSSDDENVATVDNEGVVTMEAATGISKITAKDSSGEITDEIVVTSDGEITEDDIETINPPTFIETYNANTAVLDDIDTITTQGRVNPKASAKSVKRNTFFKNFEGSRDSYKVGIRNAFKFEFTGSISLGTSLTEGGAFIKKLGGLVTTSVVKKVGDNQYVAYPNASINEDNEVTFNLGTDDANLATILADKSFAVEVNYGPGKGNAFHFDFDVFDGYNVYTAEDLVMFDNRDYTMGKLAFYEEHKKWDGTAEGATARWADPWHNNRNGINSEDVKGIAIHKNIVIENDLIPGSLKYSEEEIDDYIANRRDDFNDWVNRKQGLYDELYGKEFNYKFDGREELIGSIRDDFYIFYRTTQPSDNFVFEGNYFTIDASKIKPVYVYATNDWDSNNPLIASDKHLVSTRIESHAALFGFNCSNNWPVSSSYNDLAKDRTGKYTFNNLNIKGNGDLDPDERYAGGLIMFKATSTTMNYNNIIASNSYITFSTDVNWMIYDLNKVLDNKGTVDTSDDVYKYEDVPEATINLDRCKSYRSYNTMYYAGGCGNNVIRNSIFEEAGGPLFILDERNYAKHNRYNGTDGAFYHTAEVDVYNSKLENYVRGNEAWFTLNNATALIEPLLEIGGENGFIGQNAENYGNHKNYLVSSKDDNNIKEFNLIALDFAGPDPLGNKIGESPTDTNRGDPLEGHINIHNKHEGLIASLDMAELNTPFNPKYAYKQMFTALGAPSFIFESNAGGHSVVFPEVPYGASLSANTKLAPYDGVNNEVLAAALGTKWTSNNPSDPALKTKFDSMSATLYGGLYQLNSSGVLEDEGKTLPTNGAEMLAFIKNYDGFIEPHSAELHILLGAFKSGLEAFPLEVKLAGEVNNLTMEFASIYELETDVYDALASGDYMSIYMQPAKNIYHFGLLLGMK